MHFSPNIIRNTKPMKFRCVDHVAHIEAKRSEYWVLVGNPEGKRLLGRPKIYERIIDIKEPG
jgi:hypothetical protein